MDILTINEILLLHAYHTEQAEYYLACKQTNVKIANGGPIYKSGKFQTKEDWLDRAGQFEEKRKFHRARGRIFKKLIDTTPRASQ